MYVLIKTIDVIEKCYNFDKIAEEEYTKRLTTCLGKYSNFKNVIPNFNIQQFIQV